MHKQASESQRSSLYYLLRYSVTSISILESQAVGGGTHFNYKLSSAH